MAQAILITAYKDFAHLHDIIDCFNEEFKIFIHIDRKSSGFKKLVDSLSKVHNVCFISNKIDVNWGGRNHLKAILFLAREALKYKNINRFHLISGHDFPVRSCSEFMVFFNNNHNEYINCVKMPVESWPYGGADRIDYYNFYDFINAKKNRSIIKKIVSIQRRMGFKRPKIKKEIVLYGGETWWSLTREALTYVLNYTKKNTYLYRRMKHTFCSEEIYIPTVLMNSTYQSIINTNHLRYIDWEDRNGNFPAVLDIEDLEKIKSGFFFFARKFSAPISNELKSYFKQNYK